MTLRQPMNGFTHFIAVILAIFGVISLVRVSWDPRPLVAFLVFGGGQILVYLTSTLYHWLPLSDSGVRRLRKVDHTMIFVSIASSYTPLCLLTLAGPLGWALLVLIWGMAVAGLFVKIFWMHAPRRLSTILYVCMGWTALLVLYPLAKAIPVGGMIWLVMGGVFYTMGAVVYARKKPDFSKFGFHAVFHMFMVAGMLCHFKLMLGYIAKM